MEGLGILIVIVVAVCLIILGPFILIWSVSVLFNITPIYDGTHWFAALLFIGTLAGATKISVRGGE